MSVQVKFRQSGSYGSGMIKSIDLGKISKFQIAHMRNTCELLAITPENFQTESPYSIAQRENESQIREILSDLERLKKDSRDLVYEITDTEVHLEKKP
ncbi:MAG: hypothetical protein WC342_00190 [Methanoregula sp.]|jgi:hypothetical protein